MTVLMRLNNFANRCGYFYNAWLDPDSKSQPNNGYNCRHPHCDEQDDFGTGCCFAWACPLCCEADEQDCAEFGVEYEDGEFVLVDVSPEDFNAKTMWKSIN